MELSLVISVYNEESVLNMFWNGLEHRLIELNILYEVIFVNDGSNDRTSVP